jgi:hypothetical protein
MTHSLSAQGGAFSVDFLTDRAGRWFLESGIQEPSGGVARYYRTDTATNHRISTEITGYAASTLVYLCNMTGDPRYPAAARKAGLFLTRTAWDPELKTFPFEHCTEGEPLAYFFDCGIIVRALLSLWRTTGEAEFLDVARQCGRSMIADFGTEFHPVVTLPSKKPVPGDGRWSRNPGCYQLKSAMALHELYEVTGHKEYLSAYEASLCASLQTHSSFLNMEPVRERVMDRLHAYCYFLEGLLPRADRSECARALAEGIDTVSCHLREIALGFERSDVRAQLLRLRLFAESTGAPLDLHTAQHEAEKIRSFQCDREDTRMHGGFWFGRKSGELLPFVNPASTAFCLQALEMWRQYQAKEFRSDRLELI